MSTPTPELVEIEPHLFVFQGQGSFNVNSLVLEDAGGLTLIDTQLEDENNHALLAAMQQRWPATPLRQVLITHYHLDHYLGLPFVRAAYGDFPIIGPPGARAGMDASTPVIWESYVEQSAAHALSQADIIYPDHEITGPLTIEFSGRAWHTRLLGPNEAWATLAGYLPDTRTLFASDVYFGGIYLDPRIGGSVRGWRTETLRLLEDPCERMIAGHGTRMYERSHLAAFGASLDAFVREAEALVATGCDCAAFVAHEFASDLVIYSREFSLTNIFTELTAPPPDSQ